MKFGNAQITTTRRTRKDTQVQKSSVAMPTARWRDDVITGSEQPSEKSTAALLSNEESADRVPPEAKPDVR